MRIYFCPRIARMDTNHFNGLNGDRVGRTNCHECNEGLFYDDNGDNLRQLEVVFCGRNGNASNYFFAHELHGLTRRQCATGMATGSVALIVTNAMRALFTCPVA